jgi:hypothetical protein
MLPLILNTGCVTKALWTNENLEAWNEPANDANVRLFADGKRDDLLVVYDEYSERSGVTNARAYWLDKNRKRLEQGRMPFFVSTNVALRLSAVPVLDALPEGSMPRFYALQTTNQQSFALYSGTTQISSNDLPVYNDGRGKVEKAALTPLAVTADLTIVGSVIGYFCLEGVVSSDSSYTWSAH